MGEIKPNWDKLLPRFSIIVPIYNVEAYIRPCIDSILSQTYSNFELILVDDGSKDSCGQICDTYAKQDERIFVIHKENGGLVSARQAGIEKARGEYVSCIDGDDWVQEDYLCTLNDVLEHNSVKVVCCGYCLANGEKYKNVPMKERYGLYTKKEIETEIFPHLIESPEATAFLPTVWGKAIERQLYKKYQLLVDKEITMGEDGACIIPIICETESLYILPDCLYYYRYNPNSMTKNKKALNWENQEVLLQYLGKIIDCEKPIFREQMLRRIARGFFVVGKSRFNSKQTFWETRTEILNKKKTEVFREGIKECKFCGSLKAKLIEWTVKSPSVIGLYLINKLM